METRGPKTQFLKAFANHTMLTLAQRVAHLVMSKISVGRDPKNPTTSFNGQNPTLSPQWSNLNSLFSKSSSSRDHLFRAWRHPHSSPISCLGDYYDKWWLSYPLRTRVKLHPMTIHLDSYPNQRSRNYQKNMRVLIVFRCLELGLNRISDWFLVG